MKRILLTIILLLIISTTALAMSPSTLKVYAGLRHILEQCDSTFLNISSKYNIPDNMAVSIWDFCAPPNEAQWTNFPDNDFNMCFGVYYILQINSYMLIHQDSIFLYMRTPLDSSTTWWKLKDARNELIKHVLNIKKWNSKLVSDITLVNIISNLFEGKHSVGRSLILKKEGPIDYCPFYLYPESDEFRLYLENRLQETIVTYPRD